MTEKVTDSHAAEVLALVRSEASVDAKVAEITHVRSLIKHNNVGDGAVAPLFEICRITMASQQSALQNAGLTTLANLLQRLQRQEPKYIVKETKNTLPLLVEKIGDLKDKFRGLSAQCFTIMWNANPMEVERTLKNVVLVGKNSRAKEAGMQWLVEMHQGYGLQFRAFVPSLMELLEDADGMVRDVAKHSVIELFRNAPNAAKSDLKKQLKIYNVRPAIASTILGQIAQGAPQAEEEPEPVHARPQLSNSISSLSSMAARPETPQPEPKLEHVDPEYVNTARELENTFMDMHPFFDGKESEQNWLKREKSCTRIRRLNAGNAPTEFRDVWIAGIKGLLDGILKAVNSLRTSLSKEGCSVLQEVSRTTGPGLDSMVEILLQNLIKLCGGTKKIASQAGDTTVDVLISNVSYNKRIMEHVWLACQDKNVQPRTYAAGWLKTILKKEAHHKNHLEHTGGLELIERCVKKGLADANPGVREKMRGTFWAFSAMWPSRAEAIMGTLEPAQLKLLQNDPANPNSPKKADPVVRPGLGFSKSTTGPPKPSLRETMLAQKKAAMAARNLPARPGSAMSSFSPTRTVSTASISSTTSTSSARARPEPVSTGSGGGLSVAPMRPTKFRPKEVPRPATAGPYSVRGAPAATPSVSHATTSATISSTTPARIKTTRKPTIPHQSSPRSAGIPQRPQTSHSSHASQSSTTSPAREKLVAASPIRDKPIIVRGGGVSSPQISPRLQSSHGREPQSSPTRNDEDFTMVIPKLSSLSSNMEQMNLDGPTKSSEPRMTTPAKSLQVYEDPFSAGDNTTPRPVLSTPVLEELPVNEDPVNQQSTPIASNNVKAGLLSPEKTRQNSRLLDSGISKVKAHALDVHGFRKLQSVVKDNNKNVWTDIRFEALTLGLFEYLEAPLDNLSVEKAEDVKTQVLLTITLMLKKDRQQFASYVEKGIDSLLVARSFFHAKAHIVGGLDKLATQMVLLGDSKDIAHTILRRLQAQDMTTKGCRSLSMGMQILKSMMSGPATYTPTDEQAENIASLLMSCLESSDSGVRMAAVKVAVALHAKIGGEAFWRIMGEVKQDPKNLIYYYIEKGQKEAAVAV